MSGFDPMPELISQEDNFQAANADSVQSNMDALMTEARRSDADDEMSVETKTSSRIHKINWVIDNRSLHIAKLATKGDKRGVIEANVEKEGHRFKLELCASGWRNSQDGYCAFYLTVADQDDLFVARYRVQVGDITRISSIRHDFHLGVGFPNFCQQDTLDNLMVNHEVRFLVTVEVFTCSSNVKPPVRPLSVGPAQLPDSVLARVMQGMYRDRLHTDVRVNCQGRRIPAHKCVLAHASPVFRSMFEHNMLEAQTSEVHMHEWDPHTVHSMIEFLYTARILEAGPVAPAAVPRQLSLDDDEEETSSLSFGAFTPSPSPVDMRTLSAPAIVMDSSDFKQEKTKESDVAMEEKSSSPRAVPVSAERKNQFPDDDETASSLRRYRTFKLFQLAESYQIQSLVIACCEKMHQELTVNTACDLLIRIQRYEHVAEIATIKDSIWDFVTSNIQDIKKTKGYEKIVREHRILLGQLIDKVTM